MVDSHLFLPKMSNLSNSLQVRYSGENRPVFSAILRTMKKVSLLLLILALFVVACQGDSAESETESTTEAVATEADTADEEMDDDATDSAESSDTAAEEEAETVAEADDEEVVADDAEEEGTPEPTEDPVPVGPIPDELAVQLLYDLTSPDGIAAFDAADYIRESGDERFVATFVMTVARDVVVPPACCQHVQLRQT